MDLTNLKPNLGSRKKHVRKARGFSTGKGKTAGRGQKGQKAREGKKLRPDFEGGQMPLVRRIPKRGFNNFFRKEFEVVNIGDLNKFKNDATVNPSALESAGLIRNKKNKIKLLGSGRLQKKLNISVNKASKNAKKIIKDTGGNIKLIKSN